MVSNKVGTLAIFFILLLLHGNCGRKTEQNEGFLPKLSELTVFDVLGSEQLRSLQIWEKVSELLAIPVLDRSSNETISTSIKTPSKIITAATLAQQWSAKQAELMVTDIASHKCKLLSSFIDLVPGNSFSIPGGGAFKLASDGKTPVKLFTDTALASFSALITAKVYLMKYRLEGDVSDRNALVTIPDKTPLEVYNAVNSAAIASGTEVTAAASLAASARDALSVNPDGANDYGYPLLLYAHAGASGFAYEELAQGLGDLQGSHIVVAPVFPGEPLCLSYDTDANTGTKTSVCTGARIGAAAVGSSRPYVNDVVDLLGAFDCLKMNANSNTINVLNTIGVVQGTMPPLANKIAKLSSAVATSASDYASQLSAAAQTFTKISSLAKLPVAYIAGLGRGAAVAQLALGRSGAINSIAFSTSTATATVQAQAALESSGVTPNLFSCLLSGSPQALFTAGTNKLITNFWVLGGSDFISRDRQSLLSRIPGFSFHSKSIEQFKVDNSDAVAAASAIAQYIEKIDSSLYLGLTHASLQNWGKALHARLLGVLAKAQLSAGDSTAAATAQASAANTLAAAQGSALIVHGTGDLVANISNTQLYSALAVATNAELKKANPRSVGGVNWLGLGIAPPSESSIDGKVDLGHVSHSSFIQGKVVDSTQSLISLDSSYKISDYMGKTPSQAIAVWLKSCKASLNATALP